MKNNRKITIMFALAIVAMSAAFFVVADSEETEAATVRELSYSHNGGWFPTTNSYETYNWDAGDSLKVTCYGNGYDAWCSLQSYPSWLTGGGGGMSGVVYTGIIPPGTSTFTVADTVVGIDQSITLWTHVTINAVATITFDPNGGDGQITTQTSTGQAIPLPSATKINSVFDGWYTEPSGGTFVGGSGAYYLPTSTITLYAHYSTAAVQFLIGGATTTITNYTVPYNGYISLSFTTNPNTALVNVNTNPTGSALSVSKSGNNWTLSGSVLNILPGTYGVVLRATDTAFSTSTLTVQLNIATAIIEPLTDTVYLNDTWFYQITTLPSSATIQKNLSTVTDSKGVPMPNTSYAADIQNRVITFQGYQEGVYYINLVVSANGYSPATKQIILNVVEKVVIPDPPTATGITATPNTQVDGGWYFTINQPQNYHYLRWDFGDGSPQASSINVTHQYMRNGTFTVTCTLYNTTTGLQYQASTQVSVVLEQQNGLDAWVNTPYSYSILADGTDPITITTDIDQAWLEFRTYINDDMRYVELYSDTGPFTGLEDSDLTVTVWNGTVEVITYTIHIWPELGAGDLANPGQYGVSLSVAGMVVTLTHTGSSVASYSTVSWGDGFSSRVNMNATGTHTYSTPGTYSLRVDYIGNGGTLGTVFGIVTVPSNTMEFTVYYDANGGYGSVLSSTGQQISVANNTFLRDGYTFVIWNSERDGTGTPFAPGALINGLTDDLTLYAIWSGGGGNGGNGGNGGSVMGKLSDKYMGIPLWAWIVIVILAILAIAFIRWWLDE